MDIIGWNIVVGVMVFLTWVIYTSLIYMWFPHEEEQCLIVVVNNQEHSIEFIVRKMLLRKGQLGLGTKLIIVDLDSQDRTVEIIEKMAYPKNYFSIVRLKDPAELEGFLQSCSAKQRVYVANYVEG